MSEVAVSKALTVDLDFFNPSAPAEDIHAAWKRIQQTCPPIFWTPRNGGHWVATRAADIEMMQQDHARFRNTNSRFPRTERPFPLLPLESDPPAHTAYRLLISPAFSPRVIAKVETRARAVAIEIIEGLMPRGACEFVSAFAKVLPIVVFLEMMELPPEDRHELLPYAEAISRAQDQAAANAARVKVGEYLAKWIDKRRADPGDDAISRIVAGHAGGRPLPPGELFGLCSLVLVGGLDTVASLIGFAAAHLAQHPEDRARLAAEPALIPGTVEEILRRFGIVNQTRVIAEDMIYCGAPLRKGDYIMLPNMLVGLDDEVAPDPMRFDIARANGRHAAFGNGPHRCPGAALARRELAIFIEEWLRRIPNFRITPGTAPELAAGTVNCMTRLELSWGPG